MGLTLGVLDAGSVQGETIPWYRTMRRCGQLNLNAKDPVNLDVEKWLDYWESMKVDALLLNAGGIVAYYPTEIPYHHRSEFLGDRDLFGELSREAKERGIRVVARLDPNWNYEDAVREHPEWFRRTPAFVIVETAGDVSKRLPLMIFRNSRILLIPVIDPIRTTIWTGQTSIQLAGRKSLSAFPMGLELQE